MRNDNEKLPIVVGVDGSDSSKAAVRWAVQQATLTNNPLEMITCWHHPASFNYTNPWPTEIDFESVAREILDASVKEIANQGYSASVETHVVQGHPTQTLVDRSHSASLLVVGSRGHGEVLGMLLGSVSEFVTTHAHCPVVVVRSEKATAR